VPAVLIVKKSKSKRLKVEFDVQGQRCLTYERIKDLEDILTRELATLGISPKTLRAV